MNFKKDILAAFKRISPHAVHTPLAFSPALSQLSGAEVYLKCEHTQHTGSFKFRGALNKALCLSPKERARGVITASTGNHGMAVALAGRITGLEATIFVPENVSPAKEETILVLGGTIEKVSGDALDAELTASRKAKQSGKPFVSPYNDKDIIAGQGTIGHELFLDKPDLDAVFVAVGGGGMISGIAGYLDEVAPNTKVIGCWPENAPSMAECLKRGEIQVIEESETLSDGTAGGVEPGAITFDMCQKYLAGHIRVSEAQIREAMSLIAYHERWIIEGAAGVAVAAFLQNSEPFKGQKVALILCGRNILLEKFLKAIS